MRISFGPDESYNEGCMAYLAGERSDENPYEPGSQSYRQWRSGWTDMALLDAVATPKRTGDG